MPEHSMASVLEQAQRRQNANPTQFAYLAGSRNAISLRVPGRFSRINEKPTSFTKNVHPASGERMDGAWAVPELIGSHNPIRKTQQERQSIYQPLSSLSPMHLSLDVHRTRCGNRDVHNRCSKNLRQFCCGINGHQGQEGQCTAEYDTGGEFEIVGIEHELLMSDQGVSQEYGCDQHIYHCRRKWLSHW